MTKRIVLAAAAGILSIASACRISRPFIGPVPAEIRSVEGYAALRTTRGGASAKSRLAFLLLPPGRGRLEVLGPLQQRLFVVDVDEPGAILTVPSKKAYWQASRTEILDAGLGFPLSLAEIVGVLSGTWDGPAFRTAWRFDRDDRSRVFAGRREGFDFRIDEYFPGTSAPRRLTFQAAEGGGAMTILSLAFNAADPGVRLAAPIPASYTRISREAMERLLRDED